MKLEALDHPKTLDFAARLNVELPTAIGHLELFFAFVAKKSPQGNVGKWPDGAIARACYWNHDPTAFLTALASAGFIDRDREHRFLVHDWRDHAPRWVASKLSRSKLAFFEYTPDSTQECSGECTQDSSGDSVRLGKARQAKARVTTVALLPSEADDLAVLKSLYPRRAGGNPWGKAFKAATARIREGSSWNEILDGARRYAAFIRATGKENTEFVMQAATFCGPDKRFLESWALPATKADNRLASNLSAADEFMQRTG